VNDSPTDLPDAEERIPRRNHDLRARFERLRALRSAWSGLAPSSLSTEKVDVAETGRALSERLLELASIEGPTTEPAALDEMDARMDELESAMRAIALKVPVVQLRSTLPERLGSDRRNVLDLLDLMLGAEIEGLEGTSSRIGAIDYLITLLCTAGSADGAPILDPVTLTPRLYGLCQQSDVDYDPKLPDVEAEFFAAADMAAADAREELALRRLRQRKTELGSSYFSPRILRAIVTYNAALLKQIEEEVSSSQDWGALSAFSAEAGTDEDEARTSLFDTHGLRDVASALRRRAAGEAASVSDVDRIAWCLDLSYPDAAERAAVLAESVGYRTDPKGTAILVGLLCRSAVVLDDELPAIGISPEDLSGAWVKELDAALKQKVNELIASDEYKEACLLSELKSKFLYSPMTEVHRQNRIAPETRPIESEGSSENPRDEHTAPEDVDEKREQERDERRAEDASREYPETAEELAQQALEGEEAERATAGVDWQSLPWAALGRLAGGALAVGLAAVAFTHVVFPDAGLSRVGGKELARVSPYLERGARTLNGGAAVFVGTVDDAWLELDEDARLDAAVDLVAILRAQGVSQIMVYDDDRVLRIQALGSGGVKVLSPDAP